MKTRWLSKNQKSTLVIYFAGWGMDGEEIIHLQNNADILACFDYTDLETELKFEDLFGDYSEIRLISWSFGVWAAEKVLGKFKDKFTSATAINGTLMPIDDEFGIPREIFKGTLENLDESGLAKFNRRMCGTRDILDKFNALPEHRALADLRDELAALGQQMTSQPYAEKNLFFSHVIISKKDRIVPASAQEKFWGDSAKITEISGSHYPFCQWSNLEELWKI